MANFLQKITFNKTSAKNNTSKHQLSFFQQNATFSGKHSFQTHQKQHQTPKNKNIHQINDSKKWEDD